MSMNHIFVCGFNGFKQIQGIDSWLTSHSGLNEDGAHQDVNGPHIDSFTKQQLVLDDAITKKGSEDEVNEEAVSLKRVGSYSGTVQLEQVEMAWSRIGITVSLPAGQNSEGCAGKRFHTLVCGFSSDKKQMTSQSQPLHLDLNDCQLRASNHSGFLLQQSDQLLFLREENDQVEPLSVMAEGPESADETKDAVAFSSVSGTAEAFVASYGISVGKLHKSERPIRHDEAGAVNRGLRLQLTCLDSGVSVQHISCGLEHALLLTLHGSVLTWGSGSRGQLGHGLLEEEAVPETVSALEGVRYVCVAAGGWHSAAVSECGDLYVWGWNEIGQLGLPCPGLQHTQPHNPQQHPQHHHPHLQQQSHLQGEEEEQEMKAASLHLWPVCVDLVDRGGGKVEGVSVVGVACGSRHTAVLTEDRHVYTSGWNKYGQLGLSHSDSVDKFSPVHFGSKDAKVTQMWCGAWNSLFVVTQGASDRVTAV